MEEVQVATRVVGNILRKGAMICLRVWVGGKADSSKPRKIVLGRGGTYHMNQD